MLLRSSCNKVLQAQYMIHRFFVTNIAEFFHFTHAEKTKIVDLFGRNIHVKHFDIWFRVCPKAQIGDPLCDAHKCIQFFI